jgi:hypothetical protein
MRLDHDIVFKLTIKLEMRYISREKGIDKEIRQVIGNAKEGIVTGETTILAVHVYGGGLTLAAFLFLAFSNALRSRS